MDYWAGSLPGSMKCECGVTGTCIDQEKWCNCDSMHSDWLFDGGDIAEKEYSAPMEIAHNFSPFKIISAAVWHIINV